MLHSVKSEIFSIMKKTIRMCVRELDLSLQITKTNNLDVY